MFLLLFSELKKALKTTVRTGQKNITYLDFFQLLLNVQKIVIAGCVHEILSYCNRKGPSLNCAAKLVTLLSKISLWFEALRLPIIELKIHRCMWTESPNTFDHKCMTTSVSICSLCLTVHPSKYVLKWTYYFTDFLS